MTPSEVATPVQFEALAVAVRGANREAVARKEVWSASVALGQGLRFVQLLVLRSLLRPRRGHIFLLKSPNQIS